MEARGLLWYPTMLQLSLALLVGTWALALYRLAKTWRDRPAVPFEDATPITRLDRLAA
jgi:hypothetical protein